MLALVTRILFSPQRAHHPDRFVGERASLGERHAHRVHFLLDRADADAENQPAVAQHVERGRRLREPDRVVVRQHQHGRSQAHARRPGGDVAQERERLVVRLAADPIEYVADVEHVVVRPDGVEAELFRTDGEVDQLLHVVDPPVVEKRDPDSHGAVILPCRHPSYVVSHAKEIT